MSDSPLWWTDAAGTAHERCRAMLLVGGDFLAEWEVDSGHPAFRYRRAGVAYYCSWCGEIWGRLVLLDSRGQQLPLGIEQVSCDRHPDQWNIPGSILGPVEELVELLPPDVLKREFALHMNAALREE